MTDKESRDAIIAEAMEWLRTPFHHEARVKGGGVDCANYLIGVFAACKLMPEFQPEHYPADFMFHSRRERFTEYLLQYARPVIESKPGDIAMFKFGHSESHGSIVIKWPMIIHAYVQ